MLVFSFKKYYCWNKIIPQLTLTIYRIKKILERDYHPFNFVCVMCSLYVDVKAVQAIKILPHGNAKRGTELNRPYIRTDSSLLTY